MIWFRTIDLAAINQLSDGTMASHLGIEFTGWGEDWLAASMPIDSRTRQPFGLLHGGASVALAETVSSVAGTLSLDPALHYVVGMEINANHLSSGRTGIVHAVATPERLGRSTQVWTIRIKDDENRPVTISRATLAVQQVKATGMKS
ncbi:hotdog fold thioesterase [Polymorphobacter megasporae]|uniref:hotdog fold thioesterase n=1 Tax=Glacieibacterium megasporae TaxID=2835787 RepID=UPI001C1E1BF2|nr:hotdog fold thioesterase [Polymorphobacter megasporae]UAJ10515.1 hotdog fold thioesterase [Polymorphobacter megasporae]